MTINITDLFASAIPDLAAQDAQQGQFLAENINKLGAGYAMGLPAINRQMQRGVGRIFANTAQGMGMSPEAVQRAGAMPLGEEDRLRQLLDNSDFTTPEGKRLTIEKMKQQGFGTQALQMQTALQEQDRQQAEADSLIARRRAMSEGEAATRAQTATRDEATERYRQGDIALRAANLAENVHQARNPDTKPRFFQSGNKVIQVTPAENGGEAESTVIWEDSVDGSDNALRMRGLLTAAVSRYGDNTEQLRVIAENIMGQNITDAAQFSTYLPEETESEPPPNIPVYMLEQATENAERGVKGVQGTGRIAGIYKKLQEGGFLDDNGQVMPQFRTAGGVISETWEDVLSFTGLRDDISLIRTGATREINQQVVDNLPPGVASDRDISLFKEGFPPDNASIEEIMEYLDQARYVYEELAENASMREFMWNKSLKEGVPPSDIAYFTSYQKYKAVKESGLLEGMLELAEVPGDTEQTEINRKAALDSFENKYFTLPQKYRGIY
jgi:hypothetical protein